MLTVEKALEAYGAPVYVRKQIVHNAHVVRTLEAQGAVFVDETEEVPEGATVVFSAHGVAPTVHAEARARQLKTIDATCPLVTKVHLEAKRFAADDLDIVLIGHEGHEEVVGTTGQAPEHIHLVDGVEEAQSVQVRDPAKVAYLSQTTLSVDETNVTVEALRRALPAAAGPAVGGHLLRHAEPPGRRQGDRRRVRPAAGRRLAQQLQLGAAGRGGARRRRPRVVPRRRRHRDRRGLARGRDHGRADQWRVGARRTLVLQVMAWLAERGYGEVTEVESAQEHLLFALPPELRRDLRAAGHRRELAGCARAQPADQRDRQGEPRRGQQHRRAEHERVDELERLPDAGTTRLPAARSTAPPTSASTT